MPLTIRKVQENDLAVLMKLIPKPHALALAKVKALFLQMSLYSNYSLFLAFKNSVMVAGFSLLIMDNLAHEGAPSGMLDDFLFSPEANKESVGESLISFTLEQCSKKACYKLCVANHHLLVQKLLSSDSASFNQHGFAFVKNLGKKEKPGKVFSLLNYGVNIREANKTDLKQILELYKQPDMDDKVLSLEAGEALYLKMSANPNYKLYVTFSGQDFVGTFALCIVPSLFQQGSNLGIIEDVMVSPRAQGKGIGKLMIGFALELAEKMNCYKLALSSNKKRAGAHRFYKALGFVESGASLLVQVPAAQVAEEKPCCIM